jgi:anti-sigma factor RsiW
MTTSASPDDARLLIHAYLDGELDPVDAVEMERRLAGDAALAAERDRVAALRQLITEHLPKETMPDGLAGRIESALRIRQPGGWSWRMPAAAAILAATIASGTTWLMLRAAPTETSANLVVASHMRALMAQQPADISSSDRHTVKPWFNGRIPEAPRVVDLSDKGFPLIGGRIDVVGTRPVPTLVYGHRKHVISLIGVPITHGAMPVGRQTIAGYNVLSWRDGDTAYWAVSDLGLDDLETFANAFRDPDSGR